MDTLHSKYILSDKCVCTQDGGGNGARVFATRAVYLSNRPELCLETL